MYTISATTQLQLHHYYYYYYYYGAVFYKQIAAPTRKKGRSLDSLGVCVCVSFILLRLLHPKRTLAPPF